MMVQTKSPATVLARVRTVSSRMSMALNGITGAKPMNTPTAVPRARAGGEPCSSFSRWNSRAILPAMSADQEGRAHRLSQPGGRSPAASPRVRVKVRSSPVAQLTEGVRVPLRTSAASCCR